MVFDEWSGRALVTAVITLHAATQHNTTLMCNESDLTDHILLVSSVVDHVTSVVGQSSRGFCLPSVQWLLKRRHLMEEWSVFPIGKSSFMGWQHIGKE